MSRFEGGEIPIPDYDSSDTRNFNQKVEFYNDVYIYGDLYADIESENLLWADNVELTSLTLSQNLFVNGISTFIGTTTHYDINTDYLTVYQQHNVGASGTVFVAISSTSDENGLVGGRVGIGTTQPDARFQVGIGETSFIVDEFGLVGIGTTQPVDTFQIGYSKEDGLSPQDTFVVSGLGSVGIGTTRVGGDWAVASGLYDDDTHGPLKLDVDGSIRVARNIYDSSGSPGQNGFFMNRDATGIRWVSFEPDFSEGIFIQENGSYIPSVGAAQSFTVLNFTQVNSNGTGTDNIVAVPNAGNPTLIADIQSKDFWGFNGNNIYRMSNVGINNSNPSSTLDITGTVHATGEVDFDSTLNVDGTTTLKDTLDVDGGTTLNSTLDVDGLATFNDITDATSPTSGSVQIDGGVGIVKKIICR